MNNYFVEIEKGELNGVEVRKGDLIVLDENVSNLYNKTRIAKVLYHDKMPNDVHIEDTRGILYSLSNFAQYNHHVEKNYCTQNDNNCNTCSLVNYNKDCHNNLI